MYVSDILESLFFTFFTSNILPTKKINQVIKLIIKNFLFLNAKIAKSEAIK